MKIYALLILLLIGSGSAISQGCSNTLSGKIIDFHDNTALSEAQLIIIETQDTIPSNAKGEFQFTGLCDQTCRIQVSHPYCLAKEYTIKISGDTYKTFRLEHHLEELNQILIEGKSYSRTSNTLPEKKILKEDLDRYQSGSLGEILNSISGVSSLNTGNSVVKPLINGLHSSRVVTINNGIRMEDQEWGVEHAPNIDINTAGNITVIKGAGALQYGGDAIGGIVVVNPSKAPIKDSLYGKTLLAGVSNGRGASLTSQLTKSYSNGWYAMVQGTIKRFGDVEVADYILSNTGVFERNVSFRFGINRFTYGIEGSYALVKNDLGILRASHLGGAQDQIRAIESAVPLLVEDFTYEIEAPKQEITHHLASIKAFKTFETLGTLRFQYGFQQNNRLEFDIRRGDDRDKAASDLQLITHTIHLDWDTELFDPLQLKMGLVSRYQDNFANPETGIRRLIPDYEKYDMGGYGILAYEVNPKLSIEAGGRFDYTHIDALKFYRSTFWESRNYDNIFSDIEIEEENNQVLTNPVLDFYNPSATLGVTYQFDDVHQVYFNYSLSSRSPNPSELFSEGLHHSASRIELGDLRFKSETAHKFSFTLERNHKGFGYTVNPYLNTISDFIVIEPTEIRQTIRGNFQVWEYRQTNAQLLGVDLDAFYAFSEHFRVNHQFSLVKGYDRTRSEALINMPPVSTKNELVYQHKKWHQLVLKLQSEYVFRQNEFPDHNFEVFVPETETLTTVDVSTPPLAYHLLHFNANMAFQMNTKTQLTLGVRVNNMLDTSYRNYLNRLRYYTDDLGRNITINIKINY